MREHTLDGGQPPCDWDDLADRDAANGPAHRILATVCVATVAVMAILVVGQTLLGTT